MTNPNESLQSELNALKAMNSVDKSMMLKAARETYASSTIDRDKAAADEEAILDQIRVLAEQRNTAKQQYAEAQYAIERSLQIISALEEDKRPKPSVQAV